jgi:hypothetical protein
MMISPGHARLQGRATGKLESDLIEDALRNSGTLHSDSNMHQRSAPLTIPNQIGRRSEVRNIVGSSDSAQKKTIMRQANCNCDKSGKF